MHRLRARIVSSRFGRVSGLVLAIALSWGCAPGEAPRAGAGPHTPAVEDAARGPDVDDDDGAGGGQAEDGARGGEEGDGAGGAGGVEVVEAGNRADAAPAELEGEGPILKRLPLFDRLPEGTRAVAAVRSPAVIDRLIDLRGVVESFGPEGVALLERVKQIAGHDLSDPTTWSQFGIDPNQPLGIAVLETDPLVLVVGWSTTDVELQRTLIHAAAAGVVPLAGRRTEDRILLGRADREGPAIGWTGDEAILVLGDALAAGHAANIVGSLIDAHTTMADLLRVQKSIVRLRKGRDLAVVIDLPTIVKNGLLSAVQDASIRALLGREAHHRRFREFEEANRLADDRFRKQTAEVVTRRRITWNELALRSALYPFGPLALGLDLTADGVLLTATQALEAGSIPSQVLRTRAPLPTKKAIIDGGSAAELQLRLNVEALGIWLRGLALVINRSDIIDLEAAFRSTVGIDLRRITDRMLSGSLRVDVGVDQGAHGDAPLQYAIEFGLQDAPAMKTALSKMATSFEEMAVSGIDRYALRLPVVGSLWVRLVGESLVVATDPATLERATAPAPAPTPPAKDAGASPVGGAGGAGGGSLETGAGGAGGGTDEAGPVVGSYLDIEPTLGVRAVEFLPEAMIAQSDPWLVAGKRMLGAVGTVSMSLVPDPEGVHLSVRIGTPEGGVVPMIREMVGAVGAALNATGAWDQR